MVMPLEITAFDRGVRPLLQLALANKAEAVPNFRSDLILQDRIEKLGLVEDKKH